MQEATQTKNIKIKFVQTCSARFARIRVHVLTALEYLHRCVVSDVLRFASHTESEGQKKRSRTTPVELSRGRPESATCIDRIAMRQ